MPPYADTATWIAVGFAVGAAVLALAALLVLLGLVLRRGRLEQPGSRETAAALADAREESRRSRELADIASTLDLDAVLERTLHAASESTGVEAAMAVLSRDDEEPLVATIGLTAEEALRQPVSTRPPGAARAVRIGYHYGPEDAPPDDAEDGRIGGGVAVPVRDGDDVLGTLALFWRGARAREEDEAVARLEELAAGAAPAIRNARRFYEARRLADLDPLTSLGNRRFFYATLERECARADRYERRLALVVLDVDDFKEINDRIGHLAGDRVLAEVAGRVRRATRATDVACRVGGDELAVILPEAGEADAESLFRRVQLELAGGIGESAERVRLSAGIAGLRPQDDAVALFQRADEALYRAKQEGKGHARRAGGEERAGRS
ncbi:MAG TPA: GGDEF domain-containing protein [Gaiellaceae bacterium]|nr:GGDEF domain-containing protein [Gaiellaceae bacterium]